ncbi:MAG TPA: M23 family metallopeptidase [Hansschlegelia sp.]
MHAGRATRSLNAGNPAIDLGLDPLSAAGGSGPPDPRAVSLRWLAGTVLTGLAGAGLLGGAIVSTVQDGSNVVDALRIAASIQRPDEGRITSGARKGDKLVMEPETAAARQAIRVSTTTSHGDREIVKMRPFVRVIAPLAQAPTEFASQVPPYDPIKAVSAAPDRTAPDPDSDGDLSFTVSNLAAEKIGPDDGPTVPPVDVRTRVREAAAFEVASRYQPAQIAPGMQSRLAYAAEAAAGGPPLGAADMRPLLHNMTLVAKSAQDAPESAPPGEKTVTVATDSPLAAALVRDAGVAPEDARAVADKFAGRDGYGIASVMAGQRLRVLMGRSAAPGLNRLQPVRVSLLDAEGGHIGSVALSDMGDYVAVAELSDLSDEPVSDEDGGDDAEPAAAGGGRMRLYNGLYEAALRNSVPKPVIDEMVRIVAYDIDFNKPVGPTDDFEVFYCDPNEPGGDGEVAFMSLSIGGEKRRFYRFETADDGFTDYYDDAGKSAKKFLMRKPMNGGVMRSGFGFRRHPVLGYSKMHTGVDWAAPTGTPIVASGNGTVEKAGWVNGYGRQVRLQHANGYETTYNHMSGIGRGVVPGATVKQGQIVGYVGSTGLSTGSHLHYEVLINGRFVNPMTIKLPRGRELDGEALAAFEKERERIDGLLGRGPTTAAKAGGTDNGG